MMNNLPTESDTQEIILIEGMSGTGKSILAQQIWFQHKNNNMSSEWFHEEESEHPIFKDSYYDLLKSGSAVEFSNTIVNNWKEFINKKNKAVTNIFEAQFILSYIAGQLWHNILEQEIIESIDPIIDLLLKNNCTLIYLKTEKVQNILSNTIKSRGSEWERKHFEGFNESKFALENKMNDMDGLISFWNTVYRIGNYFYNRMECKKIQIDITTLNWKSATNTIEQFLGFNSPLSVKHNDANLCGLYISSSDSSTIEVFSEKNKLYCNYGWPGLELIPKQNQNEFYIKGFPHELKIDNDGEKSVKIEIIGKDIAGQLGRTYIKK